jgi:glucokinase
VEVAAAQPVLAIDLGGTQIRAAHISPDLTVSCRRSIPTDGHEGVDAVVERICQLAVAVRDEAARAGLPEPRGAGISSPGPLDPWRGIVISTPNLQGWHEVPLSRRVEEAIRLPTFLERDTQVAVITEWRYGAGRGARTVIYVTVSTGIGGGIVLDGRQLIGPDGTAGEVGHLTVELDGPLCGDGQPGHAEAIGSGTAIAREGRALLERGASDELARLAAQSGDDVDAALVAMAADAGDPACQAILARAWTAVGAMTAGLVNLLKPDVIVFGGSISKLRPDMLVAVREEIARRAFERPARRVRVEPAQHSDDVSLLGWVPLWNERIDDPAFGRHVSHNLEESE